MATKILKGSTLKYPKTTKEVEAVWQRMMSEKPISEEQFLTVARWAYDHMSQGNQRVAVLDLFERAMPPEKRAPQITEARHG
jgi:hypothetical protein